MGVEIGRIHNIFFDLMEQEEGNYFSALRLYGDELVKELYNKDKYNLYKNIYSYWNGAIEKKWQVFLNIEANDVNKKHSYFNIEGISGHPDTLRFINEFIQHLVENLFMENWPPEVFLEKYNRYMDLFEQGLLPQRQVIMRATKFSVVRFFNLFLWYNYFDKIIISFYINFRQIDK